MFRNVLFWSLFSIVCLTILVGSLGGFLTLDPPWIDEKTEDMLRYWCVRIGIASASAALLVHIWQRLRP